MQTEKQVNFPPALPASGWQVVKRVLDLLVAAGLVIVLSPLWVLIAAAIRLDSHGPILCRQPRLGRGGDRFVVLKFRSMRLDASPQPHRDYIAWSATEAPAPTERLLKLVDDPRVTRVGRFLRRTSLDETPQLINVLAGQMSLVGPRPALEYELTHYRPQHFERFQVHPGLTGRWQVSGRGRRGFLEMLELDVEYVRRFGPAQDLRILLRTPRALLLCETA